MRVRFRNNWTFIEFLLNFRFENLEKKSKADYNTICIGADAYFYFEF